MVREVALEDEELAAYSPELLMSTSAIWPIPTSSISM
jgi:hypothetical protein